ncbi:hypothetical protein AUC70_10025 [Methyloceanibacter stevinii]|uniref:Uncharacterized protein n=1 Tax=Methyloceanibacter stevinii TaxID=1774970 RepID=A0A1E3VK87_9HYPH|nr:hypothetical protein AUC70_10025 [Methyloceanibacter stevinii]
MRLLLMMVALPAVASMLKFTATALFMIVALPAVLLPTKLTPLLLLMVALPAVLVSRNVTRPLLLMVEEAAVLSSLKFTNAERLLFMIRLPAELAFEKSTVLVRVFVIAALPPLIFIPAPVNSRAELFVKSKAEAPGLNVHPPIVVEAEMLMLVVFDVSKKAVPVGTVAGFQLASVLKLFEPGVASHVAFWDDAGNDHSVVPASVTARTMAAHRLSKAALINKRRTISLLTIPP